MVTLTPNSGGHPEIPRRVSEPSKTGKHIHTDKFHRCWTSVSKKKGAQSAYAICQASLGKGGILPGHRRS